MLKEKGLLIGIIATAVLLIGGIFFFTRSGTSGPVSEPKKFSDEILVPADSYKTSGVVNGSYLPASSSAQITLVEFGDYQCPACGQYSPLVKQLLTDLSGKITYVYRHFPLSQHKNAPISAQAAEAAGIQGKYWEMHDKLYETQAEWSNSSDPSATFIGYASAMGLNTDQFKSDLTSSKIKDKIQRDTNDGNLVKLNATPTFFVNGVALTTLPSSYNDFKAAVSAQLPK